MAQNPFLNLTKLDILDALGPFVNSDSLNALGISGLQNFLASRNTNLNALESIQGYGQTTHSPSVNLEHNVEPPTPGSANSCEPFSNLNLKTVDEEDEFLYGESNPDEQLPSREEPTNNPSRLDSGGWSDDDDDPYGDPRPLSKLNSRLKKNLIESDSKNKLQRNVTLPNLDRKENLNLGNASTAEIPTQEYPSHRLESDNSTSLSRTERNNYPEISSSGVETKSKYHAAAEILKKRKVEKTNIINNPDEKLSFPGTSKSYSEDRSLKTDKSDHKKTNSRMINKKHIDNIRNYISGAQPRKRAYPEDFIPEKHTRYEPSKPSSFSPPRRHSPHRPLLPSHRVKSSDRHASSESDHLRYSSSYSRRRSPSFESEKHHLSRYPESRRRYSPSPKRWSRSPDYKYHKRSSEKSSDYSRYKDRSPRSRRSRSRSRSPGYHSSRSKTYSKRRSISPKKIDHHFKKKEKFSSSDSFCSLSLGSTSSSPGTKSISSDDSSDEKKSSRKSPERTIAKDNKKFVDDIPNIKTTTDVHPDKFASTVPKEEISKQLSNIFKTKGDDNDVQSDLAEQVLNAVRTNPEQQRMIEFLEKQMQQQTVVSDSSTYASPSVTNIASSMLMSGIPSSVSYAYPSVPVAPAQYVAPQMPDFPPMMPSAAFPAPVMSAPMPHTPTEYGSYLPVPPVPASDSQYVTNVTNTKIAKAPRPTTLRTIPVTDNFHVSPTTSSNITIVPSNLLPKSTKPTSQSLKSDKLSLDNKTKNLKEKRDDKSIISSSKLTGERNIAEFSENTSEKNRLLMIEKFKRLKAERTKAQICASNSSKDLDEMRKMLEEAFGKKPSASESVIFGKCKNLFNGALDEASRKNKEARQSDANLSNYRSKLPTAVQNEVKNIKSEDICIDEPATNQIISCLDQGDHVCYDCSIGFTDIKTMFKHILTPEHKEQMEANAQEWKKDFVKEQKVDTSSDQKKTVLKPVKGAEFVKPLTGFYCSLCKEVFIEESDAEQHLKGHQHYLNYDKFIKLSPIYERKRLFRRYIKMAAVTKLKKLKAAEEKQTEELKKQQAEEIKKQQAKVLKKQQAEELKNKEAEQLKKEQEEYLKSMQLKALEAAEKKKKQQAEQQKRQEAAEKLTKEILAKENRQIKYDELEENEADDVHLSNSPKTANIKLNLSDKDKSGEKKSASKEPESKNLSKFIFIGKAPNFKKAQSRKPTSPKATLWRKKEESVTKKEGDDVPLSTNLPYPFPTNKTQIPVVKSEVSSSENKNSKVVVNKLNTSDSPSYMHVELSEIKLPEVSSLPSSNNANIPQPMDIDNSQDVQDKPRTEEEKDFQLLGIKREDFQPLVVPVPPPASSMVSYPNLSNMQTYTSNISSSTPSVPNAERPTITNINLSVPPPTIAPYQNSAPPIPAYRNNTQNIRPYSYPNNPPVPAYSNSAQMNIQTNFQTMPPFSTPPPAFRNPPPMLPYSNTGNRPPHPPQFSNMNSMPSFNSPPYNSAPPQSYPQPQQSVYTMPPNNQTQYPPMNTSQQLVPPGSECDTSFHNNFNVVTTTSSFTQQNKVSPSRKKVGNLITIVPEVKSSTPVSQSFSDNKPLKSGEVTPPNVKDISKNQPSGNEIKSIKNAAEKNQPKKTKNVTSSSLNVIKTSNVIEINKNSNAPLKGNEMLDELCRESQVKSTMEDCLKKTELECDKKENVKSSNVNTNIEKIKKNSSSSDENIAKHTSKLLSVNKEYSEDMKINDNKVEKSSNDLCSLSDNSDKTEVTESTKSTEVSTRSKTSKKLIEESTVENKTKLEQSAENDEEQKSDNADKNSLEIFKENVEDSGKLMDVDDSEKLSVNNCFLSENLCNESSKDADMPNLSSENSSSNSNEKNEDVDMPDLNTIVKERSKSDLCSELSNDTAENKKDSGKINMEICEKSDHDESMDAVSRTDNFILLEGNLGNNNNVTEIREDKDVAKSISNSTKNYESCIQRSEAAFRESTEEQAQIKTNYDNEFLCDDTFNSKNKNVNDKQTQESNNVASEKSTENGFQEEESNSQINETNEAAQVPDLHKMTEDISVRDSYSDKNLQKENSKNEIFSSDITNTSEGSSKTLFSTDASFMSVCDTVDSTSTDVPAVEGKTSESSLPKYEKGIFGQDFKNDNLSDVKSNEDSSSQFLEVTEKESDDENTLGKKDKELTNFEDIIPCNEKNMQEMDSPEGTQSLNMDTDSNQMSAVDHDKLEENPSPRKGTRRKAAPKSKKLTKPRQLVEQVAEEKPTRGRPRRSCRVRKEGPVTALEDSEVATPVKETISEEGKPQDTDSQIQNENPEDSEILEEEKKTQQSVPQAKKKKGRKGKKKKAAVESATDVKKENSSNSEVSNVCPSGVKNSSDTEEYEDDDEE